MATKIVHLDSNSVLTYPLIGAGSDVQHFIGQHPDDPLQFPVVRERVRPDALISVNQCLDGMEGTLPLVVNAVWSDHSMRYTAESAHTR